MYQGIEDPSDDLVVNARILTDALLSVREKGVRFTGPMVEFVAAVIDEIAGRERKQSEQAVIGDAMRHAGIDATDGLAYIWSETTRRMHDYLTTNGWSHKPS